MLDAMEKSVESLGTYIDVLQVHRNDRDVPPEEIMKALNNLVKSGRVRYIGASSGKFSRFSIPFLFRWYHAVRIRK